MRAALTLLLFVVAGTTVPAASALEIEAVPAWQGWSRPGRTTELELRLAGHGDVGVVIESDAQRVVTDLALERDRTTRLRIPIAAATEVEVAATMAAEPTVHAAARLSLSETPLLAWVSSHETTVPEVPGFRTLSAPPSALPASAAAFASIDALAIDASALANLDEQQSVALLGHLAACGQTVLVGASPDAANLMTASAGCGGRAFGIATDDAHAARVLVELMQYSLREPPGPRSLAGLLDPDLSQLQQVAVVLGACAALLVVGAVYSPSLRLQVALAACLALAAAWLVQSRPGSAQLVVWAEAGQGERLAQYRAMQRVPLQRRDAVSVDLHAELASPGECRRRHGTTWHWHPLERRFDRIAVPGQLFGHTSLCYSGSFPVARAVTWLESADGHVLLRNSGPSTWPTGVLAWHGRLSVLPPVPSGAEFAPPRGAATGATRPAERLALARTPPGGTSILWPLDIGLVKNAPSQSQAWLLLAAGDTAAAGKAP